MRSFYLFFFSLLFVLQGFAQELRQLRMTGTAKKLDNEMIARRDINGEYAAAIQVITNLDGLSYDSWDGVVGEVERKPGQDMVFVTHRERVLEVYALGYQKLQIILTEKGIHLKPREVWQITISGDAPPAATLPVTIRITPADAVLTIDDQPATGTTHSLTPGSHALKIEKEGFKTEEKTINVTEQQVFFEFALTRQPDAGLQIETTPGGASVYLEDVLLGVSPFSVWYKPGTYPIRIVKDGYVTIENQTLEVALPQTRKSYTLEENVGYLTINTHNGASVYFNDQLIANPKNVKLPPQLVKVKVTQPKAEPLEQQVVLKRNDRLTFDLFPIVQTGTIQIAVTPFDAQIELTGDAGEKYTATGMKVFEDIPVGTYTLKVNAPGHETAQETITLHKDSRETRSIKLPDARSATPAATTADYGIEMVFVKGGTFTMGCTSEQGSDCKEDEKPAHQVTLGDFYIGKYEVTQKQWREIMGSNPSHFKNCDNCPVENVSWNDIQEFIKKLNQKSGKKYRLPTEAEWEFAARSVASTGSASASSASATKYAGSNNIDEVAWYRSNSGSKTRPVGGKKANEQGIYDMSGNVWEWCSDWYGSEYYKISPQNNPQGPVSGSIRLLRGGSWNNSPQYCRVAIRYIITPDYSFYDGGFRLALSHEAEKENINAGEDTHETRNVKINGARAATPANATREFRCGDKFVDTRDGNEYQTVQIGNQCWMKENLKWLPSVSPSANESNTSNHYYVYGYQGSNVSAAKAKANYQTFGVLYNWVAALNACPDGWHLPSDNEWTVLTDYLGGSRVAGGKMKTTGTTHWSSPNTGATNTSGFTALPGGHRNTDGSFYILGDFGYWWSSSENAASSAWNRYLNYSYADVLRHGLNKSYGFSVRCLKDN
ncbi:MAG: SUMF1/EgtB/PvdO family nonheme iron enzyme [Bacteroidales bacterium]|nr:SUMF1/EgtB/PvdO family nonheme iron enzyme [Bacteroidales bacterium]